MIPLGIGVVCVAELLPLLRDAGNVVSVVEVEPQTLWRRREDCRGRMALDLKSVEAILDLRQRRIAHGIGIPVGGSVAASATELELLSQSIEVLRPEWFSEHLSFNRAALESGTRMAGFLLPPRQCSDTVALAARNISDLAAQLALPIAFETGVNYLKPRADELADGEFFAHVAEMADCGILLDLHNLWVNERNGRQSRQEVIASLPPERIWEIHVAGGGELEGFALDSHSALIPDTLFADLQALINRLPCLRAVVFEVLPPYVARIGLDAIARQLETLHSIWECRTVRALDAPILGRNNGRLSSFDLDRVRASEVALVRNVCSPDQVSEPGIALYRQLIRDARSGAVAQCLKSTITLLFLTLGHRRCEALMSDYLCCTDPQPFAEDEATEFCKFLGSQRIAVPYLQEVAGFESAIVAAACGAARAQIEFEHDPELLFGALLEGRLPVDLPKQSIQLSIEGSGGLATVEDP